MFERGRWAIAGAAVLVVALLSPRTATSLTCIPPPPLSLVYPSGAPLAPGGALLAYVSPDRPTPRVSLLAWPSKRTVPLRTHGGPTGMLRLVPARPLAPGKYRLTAGRSHHSFTVGRTGQGAAPRPATPALAGRVTVSPPIPPAPFRSGGRELVFHPSKAVEVAAVEIALEVSPPGRRGQKVKYALPFSSRLVVARPTRCGGLPNVPLRGRYTVTITPWSRAGVGGRPLRLSGVLASGGERESGRR